MKNVLFLSIVCFFLGSCYPPGTQQTQDETCWNGVANLLGIGFSQSDLTGAYTVRYVLDSLFDQAIDTSTTTLNPYSATSDTIGIITRFPGLVKIADSIDSSSQYSPGSNIQPGFLHPGFDYKLIVPAISKVYNITGLKQSGTTHMQVPVPRDPPVFCYNSIVSCRVNGVSEVVSGFYGVSGYGFLIGNLVVNK